MKTAWRQIRLCIFGDNVAFVVLTWVCSTVLPHFVYFLEFHFWHDTIWNMTSCRRDEMTWLDDMHERAYFDLDWFDIVDDMTVLSWSSFFNRCSLCLLYCCWFSRHFVLKLLLRFLPCLWRQFRQLKRHLFCSFSKLWFSFSDSDLNVVSILWRFQIQMSHCMMQMVLLQRRFDSLVMLLPWSLWKEFVLDACLKFFVFCADVVMFVVALDDEDGIAVMKIWFLRMKLLWWLCKECV